MRYIYNGQSNTINLVLAREKMTAWRILEKEIIAMQYNFHTEKGAGREETECLCFIVFC
jgi:hypothetical protein